MIEVSLHDVDMQNTVTANYLDSWTLGTEHTFVPCFFSVHEKDTAFAFIKEMKVLGAYGGKAECVLNNIHFAIVFTNGQHILPNERRKLRGKMKVWVAGMNAVGGNPFENI